MEKKHFGLVVIGGGPGGYVAAIRAARRGIVTAIVEEKELGGTCLNQGCIPTKSLIANARVLNTIRKAHIFGIEVGQITFDYNKMFLKKERLVADIRSSLEGLIRMNKIAIFKGRGKFLAPNEMSVVGKDSALLHFDHAIIATGSEPKQLPQFPFDYKKIHNSTSLLALTHLPKKISIVGGGIIGCEFASLYHELGVDVTIVEVLPSIIPLEGKRVRDILTTSFKRRGIKIETSTKLTKIETNEDGVTLFCEGDKMINGDICFIAIGRKFNTEDLGLEKVGVLVEKNGTILTNDKQQTNVSHIYAIGDITGKWLLAHYASHQGIVAADTIAGYSMHINERAIPSVTFTNPEIASIGYTLEKAIEEGYDATIGQFPFQALGKSKLENETEGFAQVIIDKQTGEILGAQVVGHDAGTLISEIAVAITNELTVEGISETVHPHPTISEAWMEASLLASGLPLHFPPSEVL